MSEPSLGISHRAFRDACLLLAALWIGYFLGSGRDESSVEAGSPHGGFQGTFNAASEERVVRELQTLNATMKRIEEQLKQPTGRTNLSDMK